MDQSSHSEDSEPKLPLRARAAQSTLTFWLLALVPAISVALSYFHWPRSLSLPFLVQLLTMGWIPPTVVCFLANLALPVTRSWRKALLFSVPALLVHSYFYSLPLFFWAFLDFFFPPGDHPPAYGDMILLGVLSLPLELLFLLLMAFAAWAGSRLRARD